MNVEETLVELVRYYDSTRGVGHTRVMLDGARNCDCRVMVPNFDAGKILAVKNGLNPRNVVSLGMVGEGRGNALKGCRLPLTWDNFALDCLFREALAALKKERDRADAAERKLEVIQKSSGSSRK